MAADGFELSFQHVLSRAVSGNLVDWHPVLFGSARLFHRGNVPLRWLYSSSISRFWPNRNPFFRRDPLDVFPAVSETLLLSQAKDDLTLS